jgi:dihydrofolate synthase/folylpolyglutamate synthase
MTYEEALAFWYGRIDYERRQPKPGDLKLDRMRGLLSRLGNPHQRLRTVHIAGTKGKGSTAAMLASVLKAAGYRTGLFTSPHLSDISERMQVDGVPISRAEMTARMSEVARAVEEMDRLGDPSQSPTFFEVITALGMLHFDCRRVDMAVLEVGLGGRFDSTNVCEPILSIITNISYDHLSLLGNSLAEIAFQKAGIIKRRVPVISTAEEPDANRIIREVAHEVHAPLLGIGTDFNEEWKASSISQPASVRVRTISRDWGWLPLGLAGPHQAANAAGVVAAIEQLQKKGLTISDSAVARGLCDVVWPARIELLQREPIVIVDCAHNVASAESLLKTIQASFPISGKKHLIFAASTDKQITEILSTLSPYFDTFHLTRYQSNPRSADPQSMAETLRDLGKTTVHIYSNPEEAWQSARKLLTPKDGVVATGSVFLAGELRPSMVRDCQS